MSVKTIESNLNVDKEEAEDIFLKVIKEANELKELVYEFQKRLPKRACLGGDV